MPTLIQKQRELFDKKFCRTNGQTGKKEDGWFFPETLTPREVKSFLTTCIIEHYEEDIRELEGMKKDVYRNATNAKDKEIFDRSSGFNSALSLAISLLQDKIKQLKQ